MEILLKIKITITQTKNVGMIFQLVLALELGLGGTQ